MLTCHVQRGAYIIVQTALAPNLLRAAVSLVVAFDGGGPQLARSGDAMCAAVVLWGDLAASGRRQWRATTMYQFPE